MAPPLIMYLKPSAIMYSQSSIEYQFQDGNSIFDTLRALESKSLTVDDISIICVYKRGDDWVSNNNRRLWVFRQLEAKGECDVIPVREIPGPLLNDNKVHREVSVGNKAIKHVLYGDIHFDDDDVRDLSSDEELFSERPPPPDINISLKGLGLKKGTELIIPLRHLLVYSGRRRPGSRRRQQLREANRLRESNEYQNNIPMQDPRPPDPPSVNNIVTSTVSIFNRFKDRTSVPTTTVTRSMSREQMQISRILGINPGMRQFGRPTNPSRHPQYRLAHARSDTFLSWPEIATITVDDMVAAGFFCAGRGDLVRCFHCGIGLQDWTAGDVPVLEHVRHSQNCGFLADSLQPELLAEYIVELNLSFGTEVASTTHELPLQTPPRNPEYATQGLRRDSFNNPAWPAATVAQTPQKLSDAGFFFTGTGDLCRCFHCDGGLQNWDSNDDPWVAHAKAFPTCRFVVNAKGQAFVTQSLQERLNPVSSSSSSSGGEDAGGEDGANIGMVAAQAVRVAIDAGFDKADVDRAQTLLVAEGKINFTAEELIDQILRNGVEK